MRGLAGVDGVSLLSLLSGGRSPRTEVPLSVPSGSRNSKQGVLRLGDYKLLAGFPGQSTKSGCVGGCWCPVPDPTTGVETCVAPVLPNSRSSGSGSGSGSGGDERGDDRGPPGVARSVAMNATGCLQRCGGSARKCGQCAVDGFNASLAKAGCKLKDPKHWCNNHVGPAPPGPPPPPPAGAMPCSVRPCLYDISVDPLEKHDLSEQQPQRVAAMLARLEELRAGAIESPFPGGHEEAAACAALEKNGAWSPWVLP